MNGSEPRVQRRDVVRRRWLWIAGAVVAAGVLGGVWLLVIQVPTVTIRPLIGPNPGGNTCYADPYELIAVRGGEVAFTNKTSSTVNVEFDDSPFGTSTITVSPQGTARLQVRTDAQLKTYLYSLSCAPSDVGESRPRIVIRSN